MCDWGRSSNRTADQLGCAFAPSRVQTSYQEQKIQTVEVLYSPQFYPCCPNEPWPTLTYTIVLERNSFFYLNFTLLPSVIFSLISFAVFYMTFEARDTSPAAADMHAPDGFT